MTITPITVYLDMDGVMFFYEKEAYHAPKNETPLFMQKNKHYFQTVRPDPRIQKLVYKLTDNRIPVYILSHCFPGDMLEEHTNDKWESIKRYYPRLAVPEQFIITTISKPEIIIKTQNRKLKKTDILIDDYNKNLNEWTESGGTALKYINGINNPSSFHGTCIFQEDKTSDIFRKIISITETRKDT